MLDSEKLIRFDIDYEYIIDSCSCSCFPLEKTQTRSGNIRLLGNSDVVLMITDQTWIGW